MKRPCVYILASSRNGTLYVGVTSDLVKRIWQHKHDQIAGFTQRHGVHRLVWFEQHTSMASAIVREKSIKHWQRQWKLQLIETANPAWRDLYPDILDSAGDAPPSRDPDGRPASTTGSPPARGDDSKKRNVLPDDAASFDVIPDGALSPLTSSRTAHFLL